MRGGRTEGEGRVERGAIGEKGEGRVEREVRAGGERGDGRAGRGLVDGRRE